MFGTKEWINLTETEAFLSSGSSGIQGFSPLAKWNHKIHRSLHYSMFSIFRLQSLISAILTSREPSSTGVGSWNTKLCMKVIYWLKISNKVTRFRFHSSFFPPLFFFVFCFSPQRENQDKLFLKTANWATANVIKEALKSNIHCEAVRRNYLG